MSETIAAAIRRWREARAIVGRGSADLSTTEGRSYDRYRRAVLTTLTAAASRIVSMITILISVPMTLHYLGPERFALWMTITSVVAILGVLDFGVGNGLVTLISQGHGKHDLLAIRRYICAGYFVTCLAMMVSLLIFAFAYWSVPWGRMFNVTSPTANAEAGPTMAVLFFVLAVGLPLNLVHKVQSGLQEGATSNLWMLLGAVLSLVGLLVAIALQATLPWLVLGATAGQLFSSGMNTIVFLRAGDVRFDIGDLDGEAVRRVVRMGFLFLLLQIAAVVGSQSPNIVLMHMIGPDAVTEYATTQRLFVILPIVLGLILGPLWPAYGEAVARGERSWARRAFGRSVAVSLAIAVPANAFMALAGSKLIEIWIGGSVIPTPLLLMALACFGVLTALSGSCAMFLNGIGAMRFQAAYAIAMTAASIVIGIWLTPFLGVAGVVLGGLVATLIFGVIPGLVFIRSYFSKKAVPTSHSH